MIRSFLSFIGLIALVLAFCYLAIVGWIPRTLAALPSERELEAQELRIRDSASGLWRRVVDGPSRSAGRNRRE